MISIPLCVASETGEEKKVTLYINNDFYTAFMKMPAVKRDDYLKERLNEIVMCRGIVLSIDKNGRYKKPYRIILRDTEGEKCGLSLTYYVFIESEDSVKLLSENRIFEFRGQIMSYTPLKISRDAYILDILLEKGAIVVE
jgi:hypothetical protein